MYVLDSNAVIELINGSEKGRKIMSLVGEELLITTTICMHEVLAGSQTPKDKFVHENMFTGMKILEHTPTAARIGADIYQELSKKGKLINMLDILIAGICKANSATLVTLDKDFEKIKSIKSIIL